jgi:hypothetical protein
VSVVKTSYLDKTLFEYFFPEIEEWKDYIKNTKKADMSII